MTLCPSSGPTLPSCERATPPSPPTPHPRANVHVSTWAVEMPMHAAMGRFCVTALTRRPSDVPRRMYATNATTTAVKRTIAIAVVRDHHVLEELRASREPGRVLHFDVLRAEDRANDLDEQQTQAVGRQQRLERTPVEEADHRTLEQSTDRHARDERDGHGGNEVQGLVPGQVGMKEGLCRVRGVRAEHHHLAVRHVDDSHQPEGDGQAERRQEEHAPHAHPVEEVGGPVDEELLSVQGAQGAAPRGRAPRGSVSVAASALSLGTRLSEPASPIASTGRETPTLDRRWRGRRSARASTRARRTDFLPLVVEGSAKGGLVVRAARALRAPRPPTRRVAGSGARSSSRERSGSSTRRTRCPSPAPGWASRYPEVPR